MRGSSPLVCRGYCGGLAGLLSSIGKVRTPLVAGALLGGTGAAAGAAAGAAVLAGAAFAPLALKDTAATNRRADSALDVSLPLVIAAVVASSSL